MIFTSKAVAKINLTFDIIGINKYNYHSYNSVFVFLDDIYDELIIDNGMEYRNCVVQYVDNRLPNIEHNSIDKACNILKRYFSNIFIPNIKLIKRLPISAGLGGGSSNAARFIYEVFKINNIPVRDQINFLRTHCLDIGDDATVFLYVYMHHKKYIKVNGSSFDFNFADCNLNNLNNKAILIANNKTHNNTKDVFELSKNLNLSVYDSAIKHNNSITEVVNTLKSFKPNIVSITGTGPTCFAIFDHTIDQIDVDYITNVCNKRDYIWFLTTIAI